jgi:hypothetical protein
MKHFGSLLARNTTHFYKNIFICNKSQQVRIPLSPQKMARNYKKNTGHILVNFEISVTILMSKKVLKITIVFTQFIKRMPSELCHPVVAKSFADHL